jgi:cbb3-type cytochrome oxidase subunit 1
MVRRGGPLSTESFGRERTLSSQEIGVRFIKISLIYFIVGAIWMGLGPTPILPSPTQALASAIYDTSRVHVMVLGWASFALIGVLYYLVPKIRGKEEIHSKRLASIHFWITNIALPLAIVVTAYVSFVVDSLLNSGVSEAAVFGAPPASTFLTIFLLLFIVGVIAQLTFAYNIYKTLGS